ncbi:MAG TPA: RbsD/FucU transporter [Candidatus Avisuccinivibrio pullicola]|nr:RbsD/FucU transporter [Candidatus Avisuccinivibrio pullicola]
MLKTPIIHPELLSELGKCGHKAQILIADSNYAFKANVGPEATVVYLNLAPGLLNADVILEKLLSVINVESALMMEAPADFDNTAAAAYAALLGPDVPLTFTGRWDFYDKVKSPATTLVIASGEGRRFANLLLTVGVVKP